MSKHESELRRKLAADSVDIYDVISWFLAAIDAKAYTDGKPGQPDLSEFEYDFLSANIERYRSERLKRMSVADLLNRLATEEVPDPNQPKVEVGGWSDRQLIEGWLEREIASAGEELVARANLRRVSVAKYIADCGDSKPRRP